LHDQEPATASDANSSHPMSKNDPYYVPSYTVPDLREDLNGWLGGGGQPQKFFEVKIADTKPPVRVATIDWFRFFLISTTKGQKVIPHLMDIEGNEDGIFVEMTTAGLKKFDISAGKW
jgi:hypothetical protein